MKIGLLVDGTNVPLWISDVIRSISAIPGIEIRLIIKNDLVAVHGGEIFSSKFVYRGLRLIDKWMMRMNPDPFKRVQLNVPGADIINVEPVRTKFSDRFPENKINEISKYDLDILLRFGFRILRGEILKVARYGIISLHHGDTDTYRGGPPAFWEVVNGEPLTAVTVQQLTENLDGGNILDKTFLRTDKNSFYRNQLKAYWAGQELLINTIRQINLETPAGFFRKLAHSTAKPFYSFPLYKNPGNLKSLFIFWRWLGFNTARKWRSLFFTKQWQLLYYAGDALQTSLFRYKKLEPPADRIWADPFVVKKNDQFFIFFEEKVGKKNGHISCLEFTGKGILTNKKPVKVLQEKFHLSYPFIFSANGEEYMLPETGASNELTLYKANPFPAKWEKVKTLLSGFKVYDATIHFKEGYWYLFCNAKMHAGYSSDVYLHIFFSKDLLTQPFLPHPQNPIYRDVRKSRPAGKLFEWKGKLMRPSQVSAPNYGGKIQLNSITTLTPEEFKEESYDVISPSWHKRIIGIHTINSTDGLSVADIQVYRSRFF